MTTAPQFDRTCPVCDRPMLVRTDGRWQHHEMPTGGTCPASGREADS